MKADRSNVLPKVLFLGGARYSAPLDPTTRKKFEALTKIADVEVIGFNQAGLRPPYAFSDYARFFLLPAPRWALLRYLIFFSFGTVLATFRILRSSREVLVAQSPHEGLVGVWVEAVGRLLGRQVALVVESHGDFERSIFLYRSMNVSWLYRRLMDRAARLSLRRAEVLRAISGATEGQLRQWADGCDVRLLRFPTWTDLSVFLAAGEIGPTPRSQEVLFAGFLTPTKGVEGLVEAFAKTSERHPDALLVVVGSQQEPRYVETILELARQLSIAERMMLVDHLEQAQLAKVMRRSRCLVLPSRSEGLGRVLIEAMATGTPVIGSRVGGIPEVIHDGRTGFLVDPGDVETLAERIDWMLEHPERADEMGQRARTRAQELFSEEAYIDGYETVFETAIKARAAR